MSNNNLKAQESIRPEPPKIPGADAVNPDKLPPEFKKFRKDILYYIDHIAYFTKDELKKPANDRKPVSRVLALTPQAIFVCDTRGVMDRATKVDLVKQLYHDTVSVKKLFGTSISSRVLFKIPEEYDIMVSFENDDNQATKAKKFCDVFSKVSEFKTSAPLTWGAPEDGGKLDDIYQGEPPSSFISPQQIMALNQLRRDFENRVEACKDEYYTVEKKLAAMRDRVQEKKQEHATIEGSVGSDIAGLQKKVEATRQRKADSQRRVTSAEMELVKTLSDIESLQAQLSEEQVNFDAMVKTKVDAGDSPDIQEQKEMKNTLKRSQGRELDKATNAMASAKGKFTNRPTYDSAPGPLAARANELEDKVRSQVDRWERDTSADIKMHQKLEQEADDLKKLADQLRSLLKKKHNAIEARKPKQDQGNLGGVDDDLLGGDAAAAPSGGNAAADDLDLLGGGDGDAKPVAASPSMDDDLLGGGGGAPAPSDDLLGGGGGADDDLLGGGGGGGEELI